MQQHRELVPIFGDVMNDNSSAEMHVLDLLLSIHCLILLHEFNHDLLIHFRHFDRRSPDR
ncbi:unnamed protein product [Onchocerca flexuosa]|uniref:Uncharacterized protein n=1 Tax=Onchocerca flexuosa TaxID=387005 RepID=A0A183HBD8_9BILA|nr:unnamed protein product [Onchocerca flexuosa]